MQYDLTLHDTAALFRLLADDNDLLLTTDAQGFVRNAPAELFAALSPGGQALIPPHIGDCFAPEHLPAIREALMAPAGRPGEWIEVRARHDKHRWFALRIAVLCASDGGGAIALLRSREETRSLEEALFAARMTDPLTGLTNRAALIAMLDHLCATRAPGSLALFALDHLRAVNLREGHSAGDCLLVAFADYLRSMVGSADIVSRAGGETFAVLLPDTGPHRAQLAGERILAGLKRVGQGAGGDTHQLAASAGIAALGQSRDRTLAAAETALFLARAAGGKCVLEAGRLPQGIRAA